MPVSIHETVLVRCLLVLVSHSSKCRPC